MLIYFKCSLGISYSPLCICLSHRPCAFEYESLGLCGAWCFTTISPSCHNLAEEFPVFRFVCEKLTVYNVNCFALSYYTRVCLHIFHRELEATQACSWIYLFFFLGNLHSLGRHRKRNLVWLPSNLWVSSTLTSLLLIISHNQVPAFRSYQMEETFDKHMKNQDSVLKNRDITLLTNVHIVKVKVFPVVMYRCESWTIKKAECQRIDVFKLCWRRLLRVSWNARRSNQSILKQINPWIFIGRSDAEAEAPVLWPPDAKSWLIGKDSDAGKDWGRERGVTEDEMIV